MRAARRSLFVSDSRPPVGSQPVCSSAQPRKAKVIHWDVSEDLRGYWVLYLNPEHTQGTGKTVFIRFKDFEPGEAREIEGRNVRVVEGVTISRIAPNGP